MKAGQIGRFRKPHDKRRATEGEIARARTLYEADGWSVPQICKELGRHARTVGNWKKSGGWERGRMKPIMEQVAMSSRMELAQEIGIGERDQFEKAKELMEAKRTEQTMATGEDGKPVPVSREAPDYKIQNEGLKRAMELTGTKIERTEHEHKHTGEVRHMYELPEKKVI